MIKCRWAYRFVAALVYRVNVCAILGVVCRIAGLFQPSGKPFYILHILLSLCRLSRLHLVVSTVITLGSSSCSLVIRVLVAWREARRDRHPPLGVLCGVPRFRALFVCIQVYVCACVCM